MAQSCFAVGFLFLCAILTGCGGGGEPAASGPKGLFDTHCAKCHAQAGQPGGPGIGSSKGPNLAKIGAEPGRTADSIADYIRDPKSKNPKTMMPKFAGTLKDEDIRSLAEYLAAMK
jgi:mono/diheme cytochrome c family protein